MLPIGPLMIEHRLIEKLLRHMEQALADARVRGEMDPSLVDSAVDFVRTYADRTHHGKEEDILFRDLEKKSLSIDDARVMRELVDEHVLGREMVRRLVAANHAYREGARESFAEVLEGISSLVQFYPKHIQKEDKVFFPAAMGYLSAAEKDAMLVEMGEFDQKMIHEKYSGIVREVGQRLGGITT